MQLCLKWNYHEVQAEFKAFTRGHDLSPFKSASVTPLFNFKESSTKKISSTFKGLIEFQKTVRLSA